MRFVVIGITDHPQPFFPPEVLEVIRSGKVFSGGKRHHEIVAPLLPSDAVWIDITAPLDDVFTHYNSQISNLKSQTSTLKPQISNLNSQTSTLKPQISNLNSQTIVVFASGDPLFFGFANTIRRKMPEAEVVVYPAFNSLQLLAHRLVMPYHDMRIVSLTGRPWPEFDRALIERAGKIGVLTDREHTPAAIARRMLDYGYTYYNMYVGEHLGHPALEKVTALTLEEASRRDFAHPNCVILSLACGSSLRGEVGICAPFGLPDSSFALLDGREKMITKMPIRLLTLQALDLPCRRVFWDIGFCTGSVSIEARLRFPHLRVVAFEVRPECEALIRENAHRHGAPGIELVMGDFLALGADKDDRTPNAGETSALPRPDAVFIGGHGGCLKEIMAKVCRCIAPGGVIVMNSVTSPVVEQLTARPSSRRLWDEACRELDLRQEPPLRIRLNDYNTIDILKAIVPPDLHGSPADAHEGR